MFKDELRVIKTYPCKELGFTANEVKNGEGQI